MSKKRKMDFSMPSTSRVAVVTSRRPRPIDKQMIVIKKTDVTATQVETVLFTNIFPCTITGLRIDMTIIQDGGGATGVYAWAIVLVKQGTAASTISTTDAASFYQPEQNVMMFGTGNNDGTSIQVYRQETTKTMRKMMNGDLLKFICKGVATNTSEFFGVVQFFCRT